jgi:uncharacterized protein (DUF58 family)
VLRDPLLLGAATALPVNRRGGRVRFETSFARRGRRRLAPTSVAIADPLGLATRVVQAAPSQRDDEILVLPRIEPLTCAPSGGDVAPTGGRTWLLAGAAVELDGIRPLREGTPASRIFWPSLARAAQPQERVLHADDDGAPLVVLDPRGATSEEQLDGAVRAAASIAHALAHAGGCSVLLPGDRRPADVEATLAGWPHVHARLALVGANGAPSLVGAGQRRGAVIFVSARMRSGPPPGLAGARGAPRILVVPAAIPERTAAFAVAGYRGYVVGGRGAPPPSRGAVRAARLGA